MEQGAIPLLVSVLQSRDTDVQHYCAAALSNMAVNDKYRAMMVAVGRLVISLSVNVQCKNINIMFNVLR